MHLANLKACPGARKKAKRVGRGIGSGHGRTSGRGEKGQLSRTGVKLGTGFEGGQMPLQRRMPKRGFKNYTRKVFSVVNCGQLAGFDAKAVVDPEALYRAGLIQRPTDAVKVLSGGELSKPLTVRAQGFSKAAKEKIEAAGGKAEILAKVQPKTKPVATEG